jgi:CubicO group peptidase (beta-lactamase class C family)
MTTDHLDAAQRDDGQLFLGRSGWRYCMAAPPADGGKERIPGYGWDGGSGTVWRTDPTTGLTGIRLTQLQLTSPEPPPVFVDFWSAAGAALG